MAWWLTVAASLVTTACGLGGGASPSIDPGRAGGVSLTVMSLVDETNAAFESEALHEFASKRGYRIQYVPEFGADDELLGIYRQLFKEQSPQPDICEIDVIWTATLADDLVDLGPYLGDDAKAFAPGLLQAFTFGGRLIAIPVFMDTGLLYYRSDLLRKYGFGKPPATWDELGRMAEIIQTGERRAGQADFWGFVWQGAADKALTCDALEWQSAEGGGNIIEPDKTVCVANPRAIRAVERAASWVGTISPPGVVAYSEDDSMNVWRAGHAAFMRNWLNVYGSVRNAASPVRDRFGVALLPGGMGGRSRVLGDTAVGVSKYSPHRDEAIAAVRYLGSAATQAARAKQAGAVPTLAALDQRPDIMDYTPLSGALSKLAMTGVVARPSVIAGKSYDQVSRAYSTAIHAALTRQAGAREALGRLQQDLVRITGLPSCRGQ